MSHSEPKQELSEFQKKSAAWLKKLGFAAAAIVGLSIIVNLIGGIPSFSKKAGGYDKESLLSRAPSQCPVILETDFEPSKGKQIVATLDAGSYIIEASGERIQSFLDDTGNTVASRRVIRADGTMQPDGTVWIVRTDFERQGIRLVYPNPFPDEPYGALILRIDGNPVFAGTKYVVNASKKTEIVADVNTFSHPNNYWGEGALHIIVKQCS